MTSAPSIVVRHARPSASRPTMRAGSDEVAAAFERQRTDRARAGARRRVVRRGACDDRSRARPRRGARGTRSTTPAVTKPVSPSSHAKPPGPRWSSRSPGIGDRLGARDEARRAVGATRWSCARPGHQLRGAEPERARARRGRSRARPRPARARPASGRYAVDAGRYAYARRSETSPPTNGTTRRNQTPCSGAHLGRARLGDVEQRDPPAGPQHARALGEERVERDEVAQREAADDPVDRRGRERQPERVAAHERARRRARPRACRPRSRRRSAVTRASRARGTGRRCRTRGRGRRAPGASRSSRDGRAPPADVHAERQHAVEQVVARRDAVEHLLDGARPCRRRWGARSSASAFTTGSPVRAGARLRRRPPRARCPRRPARGAPARPRAAPAGSGARRAR